MAKKWLSLVLGILCFACICAGITIYLTRVCIPYTAKADKINKTLNSDDEYINQVDVCLIGGSHGLNAFNPSAMWDEEHIKAYNFCYAGETIPMSRAYLEQLYKKRDFKLVVLDAYYAGADDKYFGEKDYAFDIANKMNPDIVLFDYVKNHVSDDVRKDFYFPLNRYHSRWNELDGEDIERKPDASDDYLLGGDYHYDKNDGTKIFFGRWNDSGLSLHLKDDTEEELIAFIRMAKEHGSQVLLVDIPRKYNDCLAPAKWMPDEYAVTNRVREIAKAEGVDFLSYTYDELYKLGFDPEKHMYNKGHMNIRGSEVYSRALAHYIKDNYGLPTHRSDKLWDKYYNIYSCKMEKK
ncbi:MAG: hypothetical protein K5639_03050 [Eubacterium sp.]|nr:hypothetical protein [Eubacterium sp.]